MDTGGGSGKDARNDSTWKKDTYVNVLKVDGGQQTRDRRPGCSRLCVGRLCVGRPCVGRLCVGHPIGSADKHVHTVRTQ